MTDLQRQILSFLARPCNQTGWFTAADIATELDVTLAELEPVLNGLVTEYKTLVERDVEIETRLDGNDRPYFQYQISWPRGIMAAGEETAERESYAAWQQGRGILADAVDWAIEEYRCFMLDDSYDAQSKLDRIIERLREVRSFAHAPTLPTNRSPS